MVLADYFLLYSQSSIDDGWRLVVDVFGTKGKSIYILIARDSGKTGDRRYGRRVDKFVRTELVGREPDSWSLGTHAFPY